MNIVCLLCSEYFAREVNPTYLVLLKLNSATEFLHTVLIANTSDFKCSNII